MKPAKYPNRFVGFDSMLSMQDSLELRDFVAFARAHRVKRYFELGLAHGVMFHAIGSALGRGATCLGLDLDSDYMWADDSAYNDVPSRPLVDSVVADLRKQGVAADVIWGDSHAAQTIEQVRAHSPFDLLFIDGDHSYEGVRQDWLNFGDMGRIVAFHDIESDCGYACGGPRRLWRELRAQHPSAIELSSGHSLGIGIIIADRASSPAQ